MTRTGSPVVEKLLAVMRSRRVATADSIPQLGPTGSVKLREVQFSDFAAVNDLKARTGLTADNLDNWHRLWRDNPALQASYHPLPMGWVLQAEGRIVGYLGNIALLYHYEGNTLISTVANALGVEPAYRASSLGLVASFYKQKGVDLFLNTTAIPAVGKIALALKAHVLPQPDYERVLFWVLKPYRFSQSVMKRLGIRPALAALGGVTGALALMGDDMLRMRRPHLGKSAAISGIKISEIGGEFDDLWRRKISEPGRLLADRRADTLRWHFTIPRSVRQNQVLCCHGDGRLKGYVILRTERDCDTGLQTSKLADLLVEGDDETITAQLLVAAYKKAKSLGSDLFEVLGFPAFVRNICLGWRPYSRMFPQCPFYFRASDRSLHEKLSTAGPWYAGPYDGDTTLAP